MVTNSTDASFYGKDAVLGIVDGEGVADLPEDDHVHDPSDDGQRPQPIRRNLADIGQHKVHLGKTS
jgi:hypothetical protein